MSLSVQQQKQLNSWVQRLQDGHRASHTIRKYEYWLTRLGEAYPKPFDKITQGQLVKFIRNLDALTPNTRNTVRSVLKQFYMKHLKQSKKTKHQALIQERAPITEPQIPTEGELFKLLMATENARDRAILALLIEGGMRVGAIAKFPDRALFKGVPYMCIGDLELKVESDKTRYYLLHIRKTKTGKERYVPIVVFQAFITNWLRVHPAPDNPENPLFCYQRDGELHPLSYPRIWRIVKLAQQHAGISKDIHPHLFRKARATAEYNAGKSERDIALLYGWKPGSKTLNRYVFADPRLVIERHLKQQGIAKPEEPATQSTKLKIIKCPNCGETLPSNAVVCHTCAIPLDRNLAERMQDSIKTARKMEAQYREELETLREQVEEQQRAINGFRKYVIEENKERTPEELERIKNLPQRLKTRTERYAEFEEARQDNPVIDELFTSLITKLDAWRDEKEKKKTKKKKKS